MGDRLADNPFMRLSASLYSINNMILGFVDKQYFVFLHHLILGDAMAKLGKRVLPRYYNNIATLPKLHCHATATSLSQRGNNLYLGINLI